MINGMTRRSSHTVFYSLFVKAWVEGVEVLGIEHILSQPQGLAETYKM